MKLNFAAVEEAKDYLLGKMGVAPDIAVVMGSGLSGFDEILRDAACIPYAAVPNIPVPTVSGHRGQVVHGRVANLHVIAFEGRIHAYEGKPIDEVSFCARVIGRLGTK